jgi:hypothetical protein
MILYNPTVSGSLLVTGSLTTTGTITSQTLVVQTITSSIEFNTGSTRNGTLSTNTHEFTGSVSITGSAAALLNVNNGVLYVSASGNVGIGTTSPTDLLSLSGSQIGLSINSQTTGDAYIRFRIDGTIKTDMYVDRTTDNFLIGPSVSSSLIFKTNGSERMRITSTGLVAIGRSTPENGVKLLIADAGGIGMEFSPNANVPNENRLLSYDRVAGATIPMNYSAASHKLYTSNNNFQTSTKTASSGGNTTFTLGGDYGYGMGDNTSGLVVISISQTNANVTNPNAVWVGTVINPRGSGATVTQISTTKAAGISTVSVSGNLSNQIIVTASTSDGSGYRASMTFIGGGGTS